MRSINYKRHHFTMTQKICEGWVISVIFLFSYSVSHCNAQFQRTDKRGQSKGIQIGEDFSLRSHLQLIAMIDDNIFIQRQDPTSDLILSIIPSLGIDWGRPTIDDSLFATLDYTLRHDVFFVNSEQESLDYDGKLELGYNFTKLLIEATCGRKSETTTIIDIGGRTKSMSDTSELTAIYSWSPKTLLGIGCSQETRNYEQYAGYQERRFQSSINYSLGPKTTAGIEYIVGFVDAQERPDQNFQQLAGQLNYQVGPLFYWSTRFGYEFRGGENEKNVSLPSLNLALNYNWGDRLDFSVNAYQRTQTSVSSSGGFFTASGGAATLSCQVLSRFTISLSGAFERTSYESEDSSSTRKDEFLSIEPKLDFAVNEYLSIILSHEYRQNLSSKLDRTFENNQTQIVLSLSF